MAETPSNAVQREAPTTLQPGAEIASAAERSGVTTVPLISVQARPLSLSAIEDLVGGLRKWRLWGRLGWLDVKRRYRRTIIGPFWTSISLLVFVIVLGAVGSGLLSKATHDYLPFLVAGMVVWLLLSSIIQESSSVFITGAGLLRQMKFEYSILVYALLWRNLIVFFHNLIVYVAIVALLAPDKFTPMIVMAIPGIAVLLLNGAWIAILLGTFAARFRDVQQLVQSVLQIAMFVTPLFWTPDSLQGARRVIFVGLNPLYHLLAIARDPFLGDWPRLNSYLAALVITVVGWGLTLVCFQRFRRRVSYWI
jgi:ABC-type polysaccharide/polyol phosphate export permease